MLALLLACVAHHPTLNESSPPGDSAPDTAPAESDSNGEVADSESAESSPPEDTGYTGPRAAKLCGEVDAFIPEFAADVARWVAEDDASPPPVDSLVFVGSSTIRRWEGLTAAYADMRPLQRGFGGAQLGEVAHFVDELVLRHTPRGVVVFAGTNDIAAGVEPAIVIDRFRCLRARLAEGAPRVPVLYVGITPTPSRWKDWTKADEVNRAVAELAATDPFLVYVDAPSAFLATGSPPDATLFASDGLHLSDSGYALWDSVLRPAVDAAVPPSPRPAAPAHPLKPGTRLLVDLGPTDTVNGERSGAPDWLGQTWNDWFDLAGSGSVIPGEHLGPLVTTDGAPTDVELVLTGGFGANGRKNGGLLWPDPKRLGDLAVGTATEDYFYSQPDDATGGVQLRGLDPAAAYTIRLFGTRDDDERRVTTYNVTGATSATASLQTSGAGAGTGTGSSTGNDDDVATFTGVHPGPWGDVYIDVGIAEGSYGYLGILALTAE